MKVFYKQKILPLFKEAFLNPNYFFICFYIGLILLRLSFHIFFPEHLDADECAEVLMAMDIVRHPQFIVGWYGQDYLGSLGIYLLSLFCPFLGWDVYAIKFITSFVFLAQTALLIRISHRLSGRGAAFFTLILVALCPVSFYEWALRYRAYQISILCMLTAFYFSIDLNNEQKRTLFRYFIIGFITGIALWTNELVVLLIPGFFFMMYHRGAVGRDPRANHSLWKDLFAWGDGIIIGYLPRIIYNFKYDFNGVKLLIGEFSGVTRSSFQEFGVKAFFLPKEEGYSLLYKMNILTTSFGPALCLLFLLGLGGILFMKMTQTKGAEEHKRILWGMTMSMMLVLFVSSRIRYSNILLPYIILITSMCLVRLWEIKKRQVMIKIGLFICTLMSVFFIIQRPFYVKIPQEYLLAQFLQHKEYTRGISGYDIAHPLMYYTRGRMVVSSLAGPFFTTKFMTAEQKIADRGAEFVIYQQDEKKRILQLEKYLISQKIISEKNVLYGKYLLYHDFSRPVFPGEFLSQEDKGHYDRHQPGNPRKIKQAKANNLR